jgi:uncharacterized protein
MKTITLSVIPRSSRNEVTKLPNGTYKVKLTSPPVDGEANKKLIEVISEFFGVKKYDVKILKGETGKNKIIQIM